MDDRAVLDAEVLVLVADLGPVREELVQPETYDPEPVERASSGEPGRRRQVQIVGRAL
jgi:hypothetical protein